jgi:hypothetical protein
MWNTLFLDSMAGPMTPRIYARLVIGVILTRAQISPPLVDGQLVPLFHPRNQTWSDHFAFDGALVSGLTPVGRGTVRLLDMNDEDRRQIRSASPRSK